MTPISSLSGAQSTAQSGLQQLRLQQAERNAEQAEQTARALQSQVREAQQAASQAQDYARSIAAQADQAQTNAGQARLGLAVIRSVGQLQTRVSEVVTQVTENLHSAEPAAPTPTPAPPVINTQGQVTGTVVNTTA